MLKKGKYIAPLLLLLMVGSGCSRDIIQFVEEGKQQLLQVTGELQLNFAAPLKEQAMIEGVPFIQQLPELRRGCEVTSLAMLLQYEGVQVDKMMLAREIDRVPFRQNGQYGNPNEGFVGNMYSVNEPGYGVYHKPVFKLAQKYAPNKAIDLTGRDIEDIYKIVGKGSPVWVITNVDFQPLSEEKFETWNTNAGEIKITYYEHSVVIVGYDKENVYVNDPLAKKPKSALPRKAFEKAWEQMGQQAIAILPNS
ncbi:MAG: C39 family peptidase [Ectobacillus sp.]